MWKQQAWGHSSVVMYMANMHKPCDPQWGQWEKCWNSRNYREMCLLFIDYIWHHRWSEQHTFCILCKGWLWRSNPNVPATSAFPLLLTFLCLLLRVTHSLYHLVWPLKLQHYSFNLHRKQFCNDLYISRSLKWFINLSRWCYFWVFIIRK